MDRIEGVARLRTIVPRQVERYAFRVLGAVALIGLAILTWGYFHQQEQIRNAVIYNCQQTRQLFVRTILRSAGATYAEYRMNPQKVLRNYRKQLSGIQIYRDNPVLLDQVIARTRDTLEDAAPERCLATTKFRVDTSEIGEG